jgi:GH18 family chitinase
MHKLKLLFILLFLSFTAKLLSQTCKEVIGYYPNWQWYDRAKLVKPSTIAYNKYSIINYCFFKPEASGVISNTDTWADENLLQGQINWTTNPVSYYPNTSLIDLAHNAGIKVMVSIGGWTMSNNFPTIAASSTLRAKFASECNRLIKFYKFDGIDIDWEYPGYAPHSGTAADKANFTLLLQSIRDSLNALGTINSTYYKLSSCFSADPILMQNIQWSNVVPLLDMINLMSYDFFGAWDCVANHNSPLYTTTVGNPAFNINSAFLTLKNVHNVPTNKINLGVAFYGRSQMGATTLNQTTNCTENTVIFSDDLGTPLYYNVVKNMSLFNYFYDNTAQSPYLLGKPSTSAAGTFVSFDDKKSIGVKANYIVTNNARGTIIWEITGDYMETSPGSGIIAGTPLIDTLNQVFCYTTLSANELNEIESGIKVYPNPSQGEVYINSVKSINQITVTDILGRTISEEKEIAITNNKVLLTIHQKGLYFINIETESGITIKKLIIN